jgi:hypothetical protein
VAIVGHPVAHLRVPLTNRNNVTIFSTTRFDAANNDHNIGGRNGVIINPNLPVLGPLTLP